MGGKSQTEIVVPWSAQAQPLYAGLRSDPAAS